jgi:hypothetical protein
MSSSMGGDARVPQDDLKKSGEIKIPSSPSESPRSQQAYSNFPVQLLLPPLIVQHTSLPAPVSPSSSVQHTSLPAPVSPSSSVQHTSLPALVSLIPQSNTPRCQIQSVPVTQSNTPRCQLQSVPAPQSNTPRCQIQSVPVPQSNTPRCQLQSVPAPQSTSKPSRSSRQAQVPQLLYGRFAYEFQQNREAEDPDHGSSATRINLGNVTYVRICALGLVHTIDFEGENDMSAEWQKPGDGSNCQ